MGLLVGGPIIGVIGGPIFQQGLIRIESVAPAFYNNLVDGDAQQNIPQAPDIVANDDLFVIVHGSGTSTSPVNSGDWTNVLSAGITQMWRRKATGGGAPADQFTIATHTLAVQVAFMARIRHTVTPLVVPAQFQGGFLNTTVSADWDVSFPPGQPVSLSINTGQDPDAFVFLNCYRNASVDTPTVGSVVDADPDNMELIVKIAINEGTDVGPEIDTLWVQWKFRYTDPSIGYVSFEQGYTPDPIIAGQRTQHTRWAY